LTLRRHREPASFWSLVDRRGGSAFFHVGGPFVAGEGLFSYPCPIVPCCLILPPVFSFREPSEGASPHLSLEWTDFGFRCFSKEASTSG